MLGKANNQSPRLVINLSRSKNVNVGEFIDNMRQKPIPGVKKIIVITPWGQALRL
jgi:hypothetical protein